MKKKLLFLVTLLVVVAGANAASLRQMQLEIVDEFWQPVTDITQISVFDAGTSSATTISSDRAGSLSMTNPITTGSTNSTFDQATGFVRWYQRAPDYKVTITNGTKVLTVDNRNSTFTRFAWHLNYIGLAASLSINDNQSLSVGTDLDMVLSWVNASDLMNWIPLSDGSAFNLGSTTVAKQVDFNVFVGGIGGGGFAINEGDATMIWTGGAVTLSGGTISLNASSNNITNINTGSSTAAVNIGSSAAGNITLDTTAAMVLNADDSVAVTASAGTIGITATSGDITIDATDKSVIIRGTEEVGDAVVIHADGTAGGIDITSGTGDIVMVSTDDISITVSNTTTDNVIITNTPGTAENAIDIDATAGGIDIDFATGKNMAVTGGQFIFTSNEAVASAFSVITNTGAAETITLVNTLGTGAGAVTVTTSAAGSIDVNSGDNITIDAADNISMDTAGGTVDITTVGGDVTIDSTTTSVKLDGGETAQDAVELVSSDAGGGITLNAGTLGITMSGDTVKNYLVAVEVESSTSETVLAAQSGGVFTTSAGNGTVTYTLPTAATGLIFTFIDASATAGDEIAITASSGDSINGGAAAGSYLGQAVAEHASVTLAAISADSWEVVAQKGSFTQ